MPGKPRNKASRTRRSPPKAGGVAAKLPKPTEEQVRAAKLKFERGLVKRGEAVPAGEPLPRGATHEIVGTDAAGKPILKRKRFSLS
jgi:hypothetical protein